MVDENYRDEEFGHEDWNQEWNGSSELSQSVVVPVYHEILTIPASLRRSSRLAEKRRVNYAEDEQKYTERTYHDEAPRYDFPEFKQADSKKLQKELQDEEFGQKINDKKFKSAQQTDEFIKQVRMYIELYKDLKDWKKVERKFKKKKKGMKQKLVLPLILRDIRDQKYCISRDDILFRRNKQGAYVPVVPASLRTEVVRYFHRSNSFHHQGYHRTTNTIKEYFYWPQIKIEVKKFLSTCSSCKQCNAKRESAKGRVHPRLACRVFEEIACDLVGPLPITEDNNRYILTIMDRFTRYVVAVPLVKQTAEHVARAILEHWVYVYGPPQKILSDNGTQFASSVFRLIMNTLKVQQLFTTVYRPEANGMIERFHQFLKKKLAIKAAEKDLDYWKEANWDSYLASIVYAYNASVHTVTRFAPFKLLYGRNVQIGLQLPKPHVIQKLQYKNYEHYLVNFIRQLQIIRDRSFAYQYAHWVELDKKLNMDRDGYTFRPGDWVSRRLFRTGNKGKLYVQYDGPWEVKEVGENGVTFKLQDVITSSVRTSHGKHLAIYQRRKVEINEVDKKKGSKVEEVDMNNEDEVVQVCQEIFGLYIILE